MSHSTTTSFARLERWYVLTLLLALSACGRSQGLQQGKMRLPAELRELSGMVAIDDKTLACVQDELGYVFFVPLGADGSMRRERFGGAGDYEGIAVTPEATWVLRSDGTLHRLERTDGKLKIAKVFKMPFEGEFEGLCFDAANKRLLVLPKGPVDGKRRERARRRILGFDLTKMKPMPKPALTLKVEKLEERIGKKDMPAPRRTTKKGNQRVELHLHASELLVMKDGDLLLLSPKDHLLLRLSHKGKVLATRTLDPLVLPQPESMAMLPDGRLLVGTEGRGGAASIMVVDVPE